MTSYLADSIPTHQGSSIETVLQSPIGKSLCSRAVRALACRSASPSRPHVVRTSQPTVLPKVRPVTPCPVANVKLACNGFHTVENIPPNVLVVNGGECSLPKGSLIAPFSGYVFSYAWDSEYQFKVEPTGVTCV
ncbi:UNVERIFIED_CONTAM: hypothetical protein Sradi_5574200 [Sesamum radiatum]|uniref:Uncharacterized protein n=1 Tax=Sesamum radiatum TaxID=300843 RepID=A0AAW2KZ03_SESRA